MPDFNELRENPPMRPRIIIASPAMARQNNGNWQTASRWAGFLDAQYAVDIVPAWQAQDTAPDLLIALHARRSAPSLAAFSHAFPQRPSILVLTGTDLYRDIALDASAQASLQYASALVLLQPAGMACLPVAVQHKAHVIYQSADALLPALSERTRTVCMLGHLRDEKDPATFMRAAGLVTAPGVSLLHIGAALDPVWDAAARRTQAAHANYRWLGALPRADARTRLAASHAMVIASHMEGGANVIIEAVTSGVPVLASAIDGNRGMLGDDYSGYFPPGDAAALAALIDRTFTDAPFYAQLAAQCAARAPLFAPASERAALGELVDNLVHALPHPTTEQERP
jgi:putative glycosyltransferase (TIGR04348 family)